MIVDCGENPYFLPGFSEIVTFENAISPGYYLESGGVNGPISFIDPEEVSSIFIYDGQVNGCDAEVEIPISITPYPVINSPLLQLGGCGEIILPTPDIDFAENYEYNTEEDGSGISFEEGDVIMASSGITTLYLIATGENDCITIEELDIILSTAIDFIVDIPIPTCDSLFYHLSHHQLEQQHITVPHKVWERNSFLVMLFMLLSWDSYLCSILLLIHFVRLKTH